MSTISKVKSSMSLFFTLFLIGVNSAAADSIAQKPLYLESNTAIEPNVFFTFDNSSSMIRQYLSIKESKTDVYTPEDRGNFDPEVNKLYYNPETTYSPWVNYDYDGKQTKDDAFPTPAALNLDCNKMLFNTLGQVFTKPNRPTGYPAQSIQSLDKKKSPLYYGQPGETKYFLDYKNYHGNGYACFYYKNTIKGIVNGNDGTSAEYNDGTLIPIIKNPYFVNAQGKTTQITTDDNASNTYIRHNRVDCINPRSCTFEEEQTNYRNFLAYYNTRLKSAKASIGQAFFRLNEKSRVGYGKINGKDKTVVLDLKKFTSSHKNDFLTNLYATTVNDGGTPLRRAVDDVGQYFTKDEPWLDQPENAPSNTNTLKSCRQSYHILMTDGYWKDKEATYAAGEIDSKDGELITNHTGGKKIKYEAVKPYSDMESSETLSDAATYYWKNDLKSNIENKVPTSQDDPAYWQHISMFAVSFGLEGALAPSNETLLQITNGSLSWPLIPDSDRTKEIPSKLDDLWHATVNARGKYFNAKDPAGFVTALTDTFTKIQARTGSSSAMVSNTARLNDDSRLYQASFNSGDWSGELTAYPLSSSDGTIGSASWQASSQIPAAAQRAIYSQKGQGKNLTPIEFLWNNLDDDQQTALNNNAAGTKDDHGQARVAWLRGDQSQELDKTGGLFRTRSKLLGDIINSSPVMVSNQDYGVGDASFETSKGTRPSMVYVGANDGMLHGFLASSGEEKFAYIPYAAVANLNLLTDANYPSNHRYWVDGSPKVGDAKLGGQWKTVLLGTTGAGGKSVFALDVTDPANFSTQEILWEYTSADMGYALPQPTIGQLANDKWAVLIANGYEDSRAGKLLVLDLANSNELKILTTGETSGSGTMNGLSNPVPVDLDGDRVTDLVYAGDLLGNLWRFDLRAKQSNSWNVSKIFTACTDTNCTTSNRQPITARPMVIAHPNGGVMILLGTGSYFRDGDRTSTQLQGLYGVWDKLDASPTVISKSQLVQQTIEFESPATNNETLSVRVISNNSVDYNEKLGWYLNLKSPPPSDPVGERIISDLQLREDQLIITTMIPSTDPCDYGGKSWLLELAPLTGSRLSYPVFDINNDGKIDSNDNQTVTIDGKSVTLPASGKGFDEILTKSAFVEKIDGTTEIKYASGSSGSIKQTLEIISPNAKGRQSWRQLR